MPIRVPASFPITMTNIWAAVNDHTSTASKSLTLCYANSIPGYFDPAFAGGGGGGGTPLMTMGRFRNYGPPASATYYLYVQKSGGTYAGIGEDQYEAIMFSTRTSNAIVGESYAFNLSGSGITVGDIFEMYINGTQVTPSLTGTFTTVAAGSATLPYNGAVTSWSSPYSHLWVYAKTDNLTEGTEALTCTLTGKGVSTSMNIFDTSTTPSVGIPTITTTTITNIANTTAIGGGNVTSDGGASVTVRGICWNTSSNPTISNSHTSNGTGTGSFTSSLISLTTGTAYYVRAYATNSAGTAYGSNVNFTTTSVITLGEIYQGGYITYIDGSGIHGMIVSIIDIGQVTWSNGTWVDCGAHGENYLDGPTNTSAIMIAQGIGTYAASICVAYNEGGYNDWVLPSIAELRIIYTWGGLYYHGTSWFGAYWSSTEVDYYGYGPFAYSKDLTNGDESTVVLPKSTALYVRAVRFF